MGIFDLLSSKPSGVQQSEQKDERKPECPYCHQALKKIPAKKTKCPHCGKFMYVRTRPKDNARVLVTHAEADKIDEEWTVVAGTHDDYVADKEAFEKEKDILRKRFGQEPSDRDIKWGLFNKDLIEHIKNNDWGLYRNTRFQMAELLRREMRFKHALETYFEVCYLDLNGPNNNGGFTDPEILKEFPMFDPKEGFLAPGIIDIVQRLIKKLAIEKDELKSIFMERNSRLWKSLKLPLSPEEAWPVLDQAI